LAIPDAIEAMNEDFADIMWANRSKVVNRLAREVEDGHYSRCRAARRPSTVVITAGSRQLIDVLTRCKRRHRALSWDRGSPLLFLP